VTGIVEDQHRLAGRLEQIGDGAVAVTEVAGVAVAIEQRAGGSRLRAPPSVDQCAISGTQLHILHLRVGRRAPFLAGANRIVEEEVFQSGQHDDDSEVANRRYDQQPQQPAWPRWPTNSSGHSRHRTHLETSEVWKTSEVFRSKPAKQAATDWPDQSYANN